jgi:thiol-disulfide isomerase/thioredoxin
VRCRSLLLSVLVAYLCTTPAVLAEPYPVAPAIASSQWINTAPLLADDVRGQVVLVKFWTFACYNCQNVEPYVKTWHAQYADQGLIVIGVHSPEFAHEQHVPNVLQYIEDHQMTYPVAIDNDFAIWKRFGNRAWPTIYLIDRSGRLRYQHVGEGAYPQTEQMIQLLLNE